MCQLGWGTSRALLVQSVFTVCRNDGRFWTLYRTLGACSANGEKYYRVRILARIATPRRLDTEQAIIGNLNEACSTSSRQPLRPALTSPRSTPNHSLACFYFMPYFSPDTSTLSSQVSSFGQPDSVKLTGVGMREGFASSSQRGSREIIMVGMQEPCVSCERIIAALSTAHP